MTCAHTRACVVFFWSRSEGVSMEPIRVVDRRSPRRVRLAALAFALSVAFAFSAAPARPQEMPGMDMPARAANSQAAKPHDAMEMDDSGMRLMQQMHPANFLDEIQHHASSGTSAEPNSTPAPMAMGMHGPWMTMLHGVAFLTDTQQSSARGGDKLFSTNWLMPMAQRELGPGQLTLRAMFSLEPATVTGRRYPLLFQQGETAFGKPIADGQ